MNFEYNFIRYWWKFFLAIVLVCACAAWLWIPTIMVTITLFIPAAVGGFVGFRKIYRIITEPVCTCCKNGDSCDCERHCSLHGPQIPHATIHREVRR